MPAYSTITVRAELKERLSLLKGRKSWDAFLGEIAAEYPTEELMQELQKRLDDLTSGRVKGVPWEAIKAKEDRRKAQRAKPRKRARARRRSRP